MKFLPCEAYSKNFGPPPPTSHLMSTPPPPPTHTHTLHFLRLWSARVFVSSVMPYWDLPPYQWATLSVSTLHWRFQSSVLQNCALMEARKTISPEKVQRAVGTPPPQTHSAISSLKPMTTTSPISQKIRELLQKVQAENMQNSAGSWGMQM